MADLLLGRHSRARGVVPRARQETTRGSEVVERKEALSPSSELTHPRPTKGEGKDHALRCALRGAGDVPAGERDNWSAVVHPAPYLDPKGRGDKSMVRKG